MITVKYYVPRYMAIKVEGIKIKEIIMSYIVQLSLDHLITYQLCLGQLRKLKHHMCSKQSDK